MVPGGRLIGISGVAAVNRPPVGSLFYLYQTVTYRFGASTAMPGRIGLWRRAGTAAAEELVTPFDTSAKFVCLVGTNLIREPCPPAAGLEAVRGLELQLVGQSDNAPQGQSEPETFALTTQIPFLNKVN